MNDRIYAIFRQIDGGPGWRPGIHWEAQFFDRDAGAMRDDFPYPVALAWLTAYGPETGIGTCLDFVLVPDHLRRRGYARRLIAECEKRWPDLWLTEAISPEGEALLAAIEREDAGAGAAASLPPDEPTIRAAVRAFIQAEFLPGADPAELKDDTSLVTGGILDPVGVVRVANWLARRFGVRIELAGSYGIYAHFDSIAAIARMVRERLAAGDPP